MTVVTRIKTENIGDAVSSPAHYFPFLKDSELLDIEAVDPRKDYGALIFGGGGLLHNKWVETMSEVAKGTTSKLITWGCGSNDHDRKLIIHPKFLDDYTLVGLRDYGNPWRYIPCPSCLNPAFDTIKANPRIGFGIYERFDDPIPIQGPRINNRGKFDNLPQVLDWISRCQVLITNSFHGAYWALLMEIRVLLWKPSISRFFSFSAHIEEVDEIDWLAKVIFKPEEIPVLHLETCRKLNQDFATDVKELTDG